MALTLLFLVVALFIGHLGLGRNAWTLWLLAALLSLQQGLADSPALFAIAAIPAGVLLLLLNHRATRMALITRPVFTALEKALPPISETEQAAIDAGTVSWDGELFRPRPDWRELYAMPAPGLSDEERAFVDGPVEELCRMLDDWRISHERDDLPREVWRFMKRHRFFGLVIDREHGGLGFSALAHSTVVMKISTRSIAAAVTVMVPNSLGPGELIHRYGTPEQQRYYLPRLARGTEIPCFALTSPVAGSDAAAITDEGIVCHGEWQGERVLGLRLNWDKRYITLAPVATLLGLAFKARDPDHLLGNRTELGITCALIPADLPGVELGARHRPMNCNFMNGPTRGHDVFIPLSQVIGGQAGLGRGWVMLMNCLSIGRSISLPALSTGAGKLCTLTTGAYARVRCQFGTHIGQFEGVQEAMGAIGALTYRMDAARLLTVNLVDQGEQPSVPSAILKYHNTESMRQAVNHAMDIHGGRGIIEGPRNYLARIYQAIPISITVEGANILTRNLMIFGQGAVRCHPTLLAEMEAVRHSNRRLGLKALDTLLQAHIRKLVQAGCRAFLLGISAGRLSRPDAPAAHRRHLQRLEHLCAAFVLVSDLALLVLGGKLKFRESTSARLGDCLSHLYLASAVLKHHKDQGMPASDKALVDWTLADSCWQIHRALTEVLENFPLPVAGRLLRWWALPPGSGCRRPVDQLNKTISALMMEPGEARRRLTADLFLNPEASDPVGRLELALSAQRELEGLAQRLRQAGLDPDHLNSEPSVTIDPQCGISRADLDRYRQLRAVAADTIAVDEYLWATTDAAKRRRG